MQTLKFLFVIFLIALNIYTFSHKRYENISEGGSPNIFNLIKWKIIGEKQEWPKLSKPDMQHTHDFPGVMNENGVLVTYINHSTCLIQIKGLNILTDPIWSEYAGPFGKFGVKRSIYPGVNIEQLPKIDVILISHSHYDHLDLPSIDAITQINKPRIITGLGVSKDINYCKNNKDHCFELNWWDAVKINDTRLNFVPAHHWSSRFIFDKNTSLWGGFVIEAGEDNIYFAGDTGFADGKIFEAIKNKFDYFTVSLLPIGAYKPEWFFREMHISPEEAVKIFSMIGSKYAIPLHFDTFQLSDEKYQDPLLDLEEAILKYNIPNNRFIVAKPGETLEFIEKK